MKFGTVLASVSAATLLIAQPASAAMGPDSLPAPGMKMTGIDSRAGSPVGQSEKMVGETALPIIAIIAALAFLILVVADEDSFDDIDELPASP